MQVQLNVVLYTSIKEMSTYKRNNFTHGIGKLQGLSMRLESGIYLNVQCWNQLSPLTLKYSFSRIYTTFKT